MDNQQVTISASDFKRLRNHKKNSMRLITEQAAEIRNLQHKLLEYDNFYRVISKYNEELFEGNHGQFKKNLRYYNKKLYKEIFMTTNYMLLITPQDDRRAVSWDVIVEIAQYLKTNSGFHSPVIITDYSYSTDDSDNSSDMVGVLRLINNTVERENARKFPEALTYLQNKYEVNIKTLPATL